MKKLLLLISIAFISTLLYSQEMENIVPMSPNAASIAKYGEIPVGYFTGVPSINIPIYTFESGSLKLPLSLNYHAGGNKVEAIASWVGLGWSLGTVPSISRSVRGMADEKAGGYFSRFGGKTIYEMWDERPSEGSYTYDRLREFLYKGEVDSEPDIFYYSIPGESGKFYFCQKTSKFIAFPRTNTKITGNGYTFHIQTQDGTDYFFNEKEIHSTVISLNIEDNTNTVTTWYASRILSADQQDTIKFEYRLESQRFKTITPRTKHQYISGVVQGFPADQNLPSYMTNNIVAALQLEKIIFKNGFAQFYESSEERADLIGGYSLDSISIFNSDNQLINKYDFSYKFLMGSGCPECYSQSKKWMLLDKMESVSSDRKVKLPHQFTYKETGIPSSRVSAAQDYWGYYNGADFNTDLIPPINIPSNVYPIQTTGANRHVNAAKSDFAILKKITYPTGGYTEFDFENNEVDSDELEPQYVEELNFIAGDNYFGEGDNIPVTNSFESDVFTIDNPSNEFLNGGNANGGAFVRFEIKYPGCVLSEGADECARFRIHGVSPGSNIVYDLWYNRSFYLPNGNYQLTASFNQDPPQYQFFMFLAKWFKVVPSENQNKLAGGLRVKEIRSFASSVSEPLIKRYKYSNDINSTISSGDIFGSTNFSYAHPISLDHWTYVSIGGSSCIWELDPTEFLRIKTYSNIQQISHSGSFVGYANVIEETENVDETGFKSFKFSTARDYIDERFPFPPSVSNELARGQLLEEINYKKTEESFIPVMKKVLDYTDYTIEPNDMPSEEPDYPLGLKWGNNLIGVYSYIECDPVDSPPLETRYNRAQNITLYGLKIGRSVLSKETVENYYENNTTKTTTEYYYDANFHINLTKTITFDNNGDTIKNVMFYPQDYESVENFGALINNNIVRPIDSRTYFGNKLINGSQVKYNDYGKPIDVFNFESDVPDIVFSSNDPYSFTHKKDVLYYANGKVKQIKQEDNLSTYFVWAYNGQYPVVKIESSNINFPVDQIQTAVKSLTLNGDDNKANIDMDISLLKSCVEPYVNNSEMVTYYTFKKLVGLTSTTDINGRGNYFEYDPFGRLQFIKDDKGNILKEYEYSIQEKDNFKVVFDIKTVESDLGEVICEETVELGGVCNVHIVPISGYHVVDLMINGVSKGNVTDYNIENITAHQNIEVHYGINSYTISSAITGSGYIDPAGNITADYGSTKAFAFTPAVGYHIGNVLVNGVSQGAVSSYAFTNISSNQSISVEFAINTYSITASKTGNGTISSEGVSNVNYLASKTYTFTPAFGYHIANVIVNGVSKGVVPNYTISDVSSNQSISVEFVINTYTITASKTGNGSISSEGVSNVNYGAGKTYTCTPAFGYHIGNVLVNGVSQGAVSSYTFTNISSNQNISVEFVINTYTITASKTGSGTISSEGVTSVNYLASKTYTFTPAFGYHIANVIVNGVSKGAIPGFSFANVSSNQSISVEFVINTYTITASKTGNGTISSEGVSSVNHGGSKTYTFTPATGYYINNVLVNGVSQGAISSYTFTNLTSNQSISVNFSIITYTISASNSGNGIMSPAGNSTVNYGGNITYTFTPNTGYHIMDVLLQDNDIISLGPISSYTFSNVKSNHSIFVEFVENSYLNVSDNALIFGNVGETITFTISSNISWTISSNVNWLTISPGSGSNTRTVSVTCSSLNLNNPGTITITGGGITKTIYVEQQQDESAEE